MINNKLSRRRFLQTGGLAAMGATILRGAAWSNQARSMTLFIGTYTLETASEGIYTYRLNSNTGELQKFSSIMSVNPSFLALDRGRRFLYAVNEVQDFEGKLSGAVSAYAIEPGGKLKFLNQQASLGADPCHLTVDRNRRNLLVANYTGGNLALLPIHRDGTLGPVADRKQHEGSGPKEQQKGPHAHCIILDPSERHALAADLGIDKIMIYRFDPATRKLHPAKQASESLPAGAGPRHLTLHPNGRYAYVINELDSTMTTMKYNAAAGTLTTIDTTSTLPADFSGASYCADVHVSPSGRFLYGSNRGHNSIVVFAIDQRTGKPTLVEHVSTEGNWPRNFVIDPAGKFLLVANQRSDNVVVFRIDAKTGRLKPSGQTEQIPAPVCLKFV
ncbi:MAG TPA: lactonase family protein [Pyrinomonadaceae bacterium]|nr:lactonase family protein [Pyrinomonadaceae bacterium]